MKRTHPGRPPVDEDEPSERVCVTLPQRTFVAYRQRAEREDVSVPEIIRRELNATKPAPRRIKI